MQRVSLAEIVRSRQASIIIIWDMQKRIGLMLFRFVAPVIKKGIGNDSILVGILFASIGLCAQSYAFAFEDIDGASKLIRLILRICWENRIVHFKDI